MHVHPQKSKHYMITYRSFKNFDEAKFIADLQAVPWEIIKLFDDVNDILEVWADLLSIRMCPLNNTG